MSTKTIQDQVQAGIDARTAGPELAVVPAPDSPWMTEQQVVAYTGFTRGALASMRHEGRGPAFSKPGNRIRYRRSDIDDWMNEGRQQPRKAKRA